MPPDLPDNHRNPVEAGADHGAEREGAIPPRAAHRRARKHTPRWWSEQYDCPISTIYKAINKGHLKALHPKGGSFIILPEAFQAWYGEEVTSPAASSRPMASPEQPQKFRHVRWSELPDAPPDEDVRS